MPVEPSPYAAFNRIFTTGVTPDDPAAKLLATKRRSVFNGVKSDLIRLRGELGVEDQALLDRHADAIAELERRFSRGGASASCRGPQLGTPVDFQSVGSYRELTEAQMDVMVAALACDATRIGSLVWSTLASTQTFPWRGDFGNNHHLLSHDATKVKDLIEINAWYSEQHAKLEAVPVAGGGTRFDNTVVFLGNPLEDGDAHRNVDLPLMLAGGKWAFKLRLASLALTLLAVGCGSSGATEPQGSAGAGSAGVGSAGGGQGPSGGAGGGGGSVAIQAGASGGPLTGGTGQGGQGGQTRGGAGVVGGGTGGSSPPDLPDGVPPGYTLVYSQPFAEPASMADLVFANPTQWKFDPAGFVASTGASYAPPYRSPFSVAIVKSIQVKSFVMDAEMLQTSPDGDGHRDMVLIWSFVTPSEFYYAHISTVHDAVAHNIHIVDNADRKAISATYTPGYDWGRNVWKKLRVVRDVDSGSMSVIDLEAPNAPILTANDKTFTDGYVGFGSFDNSGQVRNVKVWAAASTPGAPDFFSPAE